MSIVCVGDEVSGVRVVWTLGVAEGGVGVVLEEGGVGCEAGGVWSEGVVKMCSRDGPLGSLCRVICTGTAGLRYFIRGSISCQNFL